MLSQNKKFNHRATKGCLIISGKRYQVFEGINTIGRSITATVPLKNLDISKQHAIITITDNNEHYISDFQSFNGTFLNKSKLSPLSLYKLTKDSAIKFGNIAATYDNLSTEPRKENSLDLFHCTQAATQSLYDANTQAAENEFVETTVINVEPQENYFDDEFSFDDISTQIINDSVNTSNVFKMPLPVDNVQKRTTSINEELTQKLVDDDIRIVQNPLNIHEMETQKLESVTDKTPNIHDLPTQALTTDIQEENFDFSYIIEASIIDNSDIEIAQITVNAESELNTTTVPDNADGDSNHSEITHSTESEEIIKPKKKLCIIESDSETDIEDLDENVKNVNGSDCDTDVEGLEKCVEKQDPVIVEPVQQPVDSTLGGSDSDTDIDDFEFNPKMLNNTSVEENPKVNDSDDEIIPGTQFPNEEFFDDRIELVEENIPDGGIKMVESDGANLNAVNKMADSVDEMEPLYLEETQIIAPPDDFMEATEPIEKQQHDHLNKVSDEQEIESQSAIFLQPTQAVVDKSAPEEVFVKPSDHICKNRREAVNTSVNEDDSQTQDLYLEPTQPIYEPLTQDGVFEQLTQPVKPTGNDEVFMQPTQRICPNQSQDDVFLEPTQPIIGLRSQIKDIENVFMQPTQALESVNGEVFKEPFPVNKNKEEEIDSIYFEATQKLNVESNVEDRLQNLFASQTVVPSTENQVESQLEVEFETENVSYRTDTSYRPSNPLINELESTKCSEEPLSSSIVDDALKSEGENIAKVISQGINVQTQFVEDLRKGEKKARLSGLSLKKRSIEVVDDQLRSELTHELTQPATKHSKAELSPKRNINQQRALKSVEVSSNIESKTEEDITESKRGWAGPKNFSVEISADTTRMKRKSSDDNIVDENSSSAAKTKKRRHVKFEETETSTSAITRTNEAHVIKQMEETPSKTVLGTSTHDLPEIRTKKPTEVRSKTLRPPESDVKKPLPQTDKTSQDVVQNTSISDESVKIPPKKQSVRRAKTPTETNQDVIVNKLPETSTPKRRGKRLADKTPQETSTSDESVNTSSKAPTKKPSARRAKQPTEINLNVTVNKDSEPVVTKQRGQRLADTTSDETLTSDEGINVPPTKKTRARTHTATNSDLDVTQQRGKRKLDKKFEQTVEDTSTSDASVNIPSKASTKKQSARRAKTPTETNDKSTEIRQGKRQKDKIPEETAQETSTSDVSIDVASKAPTKKQPTRRAKAPTDTNQEVDSTKHADTNVTIQRGRRRPDKSPDQTTEDTLTPDENVKAPIKRQLTRRGKTLTETNQDIGHNEVAEINVKKQRGKRQAVKKLDETSEDASTVNVPTKKPPTRRATPVNVNKPAETLVKKQRGKRQTDETAQIASTSNVSVDISSEALPKKPRGSRAITPDETSQDMFVTVKAPAKNQKNTSQDISVSSTTETPVKRGRRANALEETTQDMSTPDRNKRKQKPKVVFTMLDSPVLVSVIRSLGGSIVDSVEQCTVLVTGHLQRTPKLLSAVGQAKPICSPKWVQESKKAGEFLDPWDYILEDKEAESKWQLSLKESLNKSKNQRLFHNSVVYVTVANSVDALKAAVESCGGKFVTKAPGKLTNQTLVVVANKENKSKYSKYLNQGPSVKTVLPEAIFDGVLRQELRFEEYALS